MTRISLVKTASQWILTIFVYVLLYTGANEALWPLLAHFHHNDWHMPGIVDGAISSVLFPLFLAYLLAATSRRQLLGSSPWPFLIAPVILMAATKYVADAFYPPLWKEFLSLLVGGTVQGLCAWAGWFLYQRWANRSHVAPSASGELHTQSV